MSFSRENIGGGPQTSGGEHKDPPSPPVAHLMGRRGGWQDVTPALLVHSWVSIARRAQLHVYMQFLWTASENE